LQEKEALSVWQWGVLQSVVVFAKMKTSVRFERHGSE
jgi:hypothetical protein